MQREESPVLPQPEEGVRRGSGRTSPHEDPPMAPDVVPLGMHPQREVEVQPDAALPGGSGRTLQLLRGQPLHVQVVAVGALLTALPRQAPLALRSRPGAPGNPMSPGGRPEPGVVGHPTTRPKKAVDLPPPLPWLFEDG